MSALPLFLRRKSRTRTKSALAKALTLHASFDKGLDADFSRGDKTCYVQQGKELVPATPNDDVKLAADAGRFGGALHFPKKGTTRPSFKDGGVLGYNAKSWSTTVSVWLRLDPDKDLEPGYCDPVQIIGDDNKKGYIFCEWSKDETPRYFRYAIRPLFHIWNPDNKPWARHPVREAADGAGGAAPFSREKWTHVVFTVENINDKAKPPRGRLYINGKLQGAIEKWDLTLRLGSRAGAAGARRRLRRAHGRPGRLRPPAHRRRGRADLRTQERRPRPPPVEPI